MNEHVTSDRLCLPRPERRAFTLYELIIALILMSIMTAVALPRWSESLHRARVSQGASRIVADLTRAQAVAYGSSTPKTVTFDVSSSQYEVNGVVPLHRSSGRYVVALNDDPYCCRLMTVWGQTGTQTITFNGFGQPDKGGNIVVAAGGFQKTVVVDANTGTATIP